MYIKYVNEKYHYATARDDRAGVVAKRRRQHTASRRQKCVLRESTDSTHMVGAMTYVPLSQRSSKEIRAQAEAYRRMALTARTPAAKSGLEALTDHFGALAARREAEERLAADEPPASAPAEPVQR